MKKLLLLCLFLALGFSVKDASAKGPKEKNKDHKEKSHKNKHKNKAKSLPPGLQKKLERGGQLPPGWQKKLIKGHRLEQDIYQHAVVIDHAKYPDVPVGIEGSVVVRIDDRLVRLARATREILEIIK